MRHSQGKKVQLTLTIPKWIAKPAAEVVYQWNKLRFWANPYRCKCCDKRLYVSTPQYTHTFENGQTLTVENVAIVNGEPAIICRACLLRELEMSEWKPRLSSSRDWIGGTCAVLRKRGRSYKDVQIWPWVSMVFCTNAWNADHVSKEAVIKTVEHGKIKTSVYAICKGRLRCLNGKHLFVDDKGDLV